MGDILIQPIMDTNWQMKEERAQLHYMRTVGLCPHIKKIGAMSSKGKWIDTEMITLNEMSQLRKTNIAYFQGQMEVQTKRKEKQKGKEETWDVERD